MQLLFSFVTSLLSFQLFPSVRLFLLFQLFPFARFLAKCCGMEQPGLALQSKQLLAATCDHLLPLATTCGHLIQQAPAASGCHALAASCHLRPFAATCGHLRPLAACKWLQLRGSTKVSIDLHSPPPHLMRRPNYQQLRKPTRRTEVSTYDVCASLPPVRSGASSRAA